MKANHNSRDKMRVNREVVSNGSKILKWKQITTKKEKGGIIGKLFLMVQRY